MKFPITRESLEAWDFNKDKEDLRIEAIHKEITKQLKLILDSIYLDFQRQMPAKSCHTKKFVIQISQSIMPIQQLGRFKPFNGITDIDTYINEFIDKLIDKLKENFIGCDIIIDPLKTYIIIDWS